MPDDVETVELELVAPVTAEATALTDPGRALRLVVDKPPRLGGTDRGPMPSEYFLAALGSCHMFTARKVADKRAVTWRHMQMVAKAHFAGGDIARVGLHYTIESEAGRDAWETVMKLAGRACTISKITACPIEHTFEVVPAQAL